MTDKSEGSREQAARSDDTDLPPFAEDGTDLTVIRWLLAMSPAERLMWLQTHMQAVATLRRDHPDA